MIARSTQVLNTITEFGALTADDLSGILYMSTPHVVDALRTLERGGFVMWVEGSGWDLTPDYITRSGCYANEQF